MAYKIEPWTVREFFEKVQEKSIVIPRFQRNVVWSEKQKKKFIESLKGGYPFSAVLVFEERIGNVTRHSLVDGLQRLTTITEYYGQPNKYYSKDSIPEALLSGLAEVIGVDQDRIKDSIENWFTGLDIGSLGDFNESHGFTSNDLMGKICSEFGVDRSAISDNELIDSALRQYIDDLRSGSDIGGRQVPVIIYSGNKSDLPEIFFRLNRGGQQLSKYEIFAAAWSSTNILISNPDIRGKIEQRYSGYERHGYEVEESGDMTLFDYLYGLGKVLSEKHRILFPSDDPDNLDADSVGFNLVTYCLGMDVTEMDSLDQCLARPFDLDGFERALFSVIGDVESRLKPYLSFRLNVSLKNGKNTPGFSPAHSEFQMVAIISKAFRMRYPSREYHVTSASTGEYEKYLGRIKAYYLYDILDGYWSGTGNRKAYQIVSGTSSRYDDPISREKWSAKLDDWFEANGSKKEKKRSTQGKDAIIFLKYIYADTVSYAEGSIANYDLDHCAPVKSLSLLIGDGEGLPINHVANISLLPRGINRSKRDRTIYDPASFGSGISDDERGRRISELEEYSLTTEEDLAFVSEITDRLSDEESHRFREAYANFLRRRMDRLKEKFLETV